MFEILKKALANSLSIKIVFYIASFLLGIPVLSKICWVFDASYLAEFGIGPELYARPIFSSPLINVWLFVTAIKPGLWIWIILSGIVFSFLLMVFYEADNNNQPTQPEIEVDTNSWAYKIDSVFNLLSKAGMPALVFLFSGLSIITLTAIAIKYFSQESSRLAKDQIANYINNGICKDTFNDSNLGCYSIPGEAGENHLLIINNNEVVIYFSRQKRDGATEETFTVTIKNKLTNEKTVRLYNHVEKPKKSKE